jgi:RimJ/RimL family protein N-acetyltransferase
MDRLIRPFRVEDIDRMIDYFLNADRSFLARMGVDRDKLPGREDWRDIVLSEFNRSFMDKTFFYLLWELDFVPVGHSNINQVVYGKEAHMHLHLWRHDLRQQGNGFTFCRMSIGVFFNLFKLSRIICEPYSKNPAPNKTLPRLGFQLEKTHHTVPGWINFPQMVNRWVLTRDKWMDR